MRNEPVLVAKNEAGEVRAMCRIEGEMIEEIIDTLQEWAHEPRYLHIMTRDEAVSEFTP